MPVPHLAGKYIHQLRMEDSHILQEVLRCITSVATYTHSMRPVDAFIARSYRLVVSARYSNSKKGTSFSTLRVIAVCMIHFTCVPDQTRRT
jgi:hypothetical protein